MAGIQPSRRLLSVNTNFGDPSYQQDLTMKVASWAPHRSLAFAVNSIFADFCDLKYCSLLATVV